jgi:hypothetical protein
MTDKFTPLHAYVFSDASIVLTAMPMYSQTLPSLPWPTSLLFRSTASFLPLEDPLEKQLYFNLINNTL